MFVGSTTALDANAEWTSGAQLTDRADRITGSVYSDQGGTLYIEQGDGTNWDVSTSYTVSADDGKGFSEELISPYVRVRFENGGTDQGVFRIRARFTSAGAR